MAVADWSTTAALNVESTGISGTGGGVGIQGTNLVSNFDNALRDIMAQIATFRTAGTFVGGLAVSGAATTTGTLNVVSGTGAASTYVFAVYRDTPLDGTTRIFGVKRTATDPIEMAGATITAIGATTAGTGRFTTLTYTTSLTLLGSATPAPTAEGAVEWDTDDNVLRVGNAATTTQIGIAMSAVQATTSGTAKTFTVPAGTKRITISLNGVSTNGTNNIALQLGDAGGIEVAGYVGASTVATTVVVSSAYASAFLLSSNVAAGTDYSGIAVLTLLDPATFRWAYSAMLGRGDAAATTFGGGTKALSQELSSIEINAGGNTFDAGSINIMYE